MISYLATHSLNVLPSGSTPVVSCGVRNNGVVGYYGVSEHLHKGRLTIALNGSPLATSYHPYQFAAKDDVAVCIPKLPMRLSTLLFVQVVLNQERWRYSYYRKCYMDKLRRFNIMLPAEQAKVDESIETVVSGTPYWDYISEEVKEMTI